MSKIFSVAASFQYSVNIDYDFGDDDKLKNFIPTRAALKLLEDILRGVDPNSAARARILIGAYGRGKSHVMLIILSLLMKRKLKLFEKLLPKLKETPELYRLVKNYYASGNKILPVTINGSKTNLTQAFLIALQRTLAKNNLLDVMPETNFMVATIVLRRWAKDFPDTLAAFQKIVGEPVKDFIGRLKSFDVAAYETFEKIYPTLTAGSEFNPFVGFDVPELYESVAKSLQTKGYSGLFVVYDEFSKFLEANIVGASVADIKMLQDFAEKCSRSGKLQLHLLLISHKEISNYIDKLPKAKVDGWRGVSDRFEHVRLQDDFAQTYEIISSVILRDEPRWKIFRQKYRREFDSLYERFSRHRMFKDAGDLHTVIEGCFPLHPVSTFILPRLSERVAQNERTLFTFLSAQGTATLSTFLEKFRDDFTLLTPDQIFDYFEPLLRKEIFAGAIHEVFVLANTILNQLDEQSLAAKIIKTVALIYILDQTERLTPTKAQVVEIFSCAYEVAEIEKVLTELIERDFVIYHKRSNGYLKLKNFSVVDVRQKIRDTIETQSGKIFARDVLNSANIENFIYPLRYNDEREMTRWFNFRFIDGAEISTDVDWDAKAEQIDGDGIIFGVLPASEDEREKISEKLLASSVGKPRFIFVLPKSFCDADFTKEFAAVDTLRDAATDDPILFDEYDIIFEDLQEVTRNFIAAYTRPEVGRAIYIHDGKIFRLRRKAELTELMSKICDEVFSMTPTIVNEAVNKNELTSTASVARNKIVAALLRGIEPNLGLRGNGQEVSIMRSVLLRTGIFIDGDNPQINLRPNDSRLRNLLATIEDFVLSARDGKNFGELYTRLIFPKFHIGLRRGLIPIFLATVLQKYRRQILLSNRAGSVKLNVDALIQIDATPESFLLEYVDRSPVTEIFLDKLADVFDDGFVDAEKSFDTTADAMRRWFLSLPKCAKETKSTDKRRAEFLKLLRQNLSGADLLLKRLPKLFGDAYEVIAVKNFFDRRLDALKLELIGGTKKFFPSQNPDAPLTEILQQWRATLDGKISEQIFPDATEKFLRLIDTPDEKFLITKLATLATGLRLEDWDADFAQIFFTAVKRFKSTAENFRAPVEKISEPTAETSTVKITFDATGEKVTRRFETVELSPRGKLLLNQITAALDAMGQSISAQEKRQVLLKILQTLC